MTAPSHTPPSHTPPQAPVERDTLRGTADDMANLPERPNIGDNFVVTEKLGQGGNAIVWRARDRSILRRPVAIKILYSSNPDDRRRFQQEAEVLANIRHPNVAQAFSCGVTADGRPYVVLELFEGPSLREQLNASGPLPWREALAIGVQVAAALDALHARGVIHRDVKPDNIMLTKDDAGRLVVKLIDFGVARLTENYIDPSTKGFTRIAPRLPTQTGMAVGTPGYMPLEAGLRAPDCTFDVYGLAATVHELCTGEVPLVGPLAPFGEHSPIDAPADLMTVLAAALALEPGDRTQTAREFGRALAAVCAAHPVEKNPALFDGRYERIALLGTGAKAEVFLANHRGTSQDVALKVLRSSESDDVSRFRREGSLLRLLDHPCIPRFFDLALNADEPYLAMAHSPGVPVVRYCGASGRLSPAEVMQVAWQLAEVLSHIHKLGILHRDIHANNVLVSLDRPSRINNARVCIPRAVSVTLIDFGCADLTPKFFLVDPRRYRTPPEFRVRIPDGDIHTLPWAAPEARAGGGFTDKSDVYSLGLLLFRLLTGKVPAQGRAKPSDYVECPHDLETAILQALNPDPAERPSAQDLVATLEDAFVADELLEGEIRREQDAEREKETQAEGDLPERPLAVVLPFRAPKSTRPVEPKGWTLFPVVSEAPISDDTAFPVVSEAPISDDTAPVDTPLAPPPEAAKPRSRQQYAFWLVGVLLVCGWFGGRLTAPPAVPPPEEPAPSQAAAIATPPVAAATVGPARSAVELPAMRDALETAKDGFTACSKKAGGHLLIEFTVTAGRDTFAGVDLPTQPDVEVIDCVKDVAAGLRFKPQADLTFTKGY